MSQLIESIRLNDGKFFSLFYHEQRMMNSLKVLYGADEEVDLTELLERIQYPKQGLYKCRITYDDSVKEIEFIPYIPQSIKSLQLVDGGRISYEHKYKNRSELNALYERRRDSDDILIVKNNYVTDTLFANIVFGRGSHWYTPYTPLLKGTMRAFLLERGIIEAENIGVQDIHTFERFKLINAMLGFDGPEIDITHIN